MICGLQESLDYWLRTGAPPMGMPPARKRDYISNRLILGMPRIAEDMEQAIALEESGIWDVGVIETLHEIGLFRDQYSMVVTSRSHRRRTRHFTASLLTAKLPPQSLACVGPNLYVLAPELCVVLLAREQKIGDAELVFDVSEICSRYAYENRPTMDRALIERWPISAAHSIFYYIVTMDVMNNPAPSGLARAERALRYAVHGARSPREIEVGIDLGMPVKQGGFGAPPFEVNKTIELTEQERWILGKDSLEADFVWEEQKLIVEYDGKVHESSREADAMRVNILRGKGYRVEVLSNAILDAGVQFETFVSRLEGPLGFRMSRSADARALRRMLQTETARLASRNGHIIPAEESGAASARYGKSREVWS